jgi:hypothetical protein
MSPLLRTLARQLLLVYAVALLLGGPAALAADALDGGDQKEINSPTVVTVEPAQEDGDFGDFNTSDVAIALITGGVGIGGVIAGNRTARNLSKDEGERELSGRQIEAIGAFLECGAELLNELESGLKNREDEEARSAIRRFLNKLSALSWKIEDKQIRKAALTFFDRAREVLDETSSVSPSDRSLKAHNAYDELRNLAEKLRPGIEGR